jgi:hypothetical protein
VMGHNLGQKVLLIDVDSKLPNLALMKLSAWHKARGDLVGFNVTDPDLIYASVVFKKNRHLVDGLKLFYPDAEIKIGGSGYDLSARLPDEIERMRPDYSLYPDMDYSLGYTSRGCIRNCYFCIVPEKEGRYNWNRSMDPENWINPAFSKVKLLDNNWYADRDRFFETSNWFIDHNLAVDVTQGMDIRLLTPEIAAQLKRLKWCATLHFAFDDERYTQAVLDGIQMLKDAGIDTKNRCYFYVYCHNDDHYDSALARCRLLKEHHASAYVMFNMDEKRTTRIKHLQRWTAKPWLFWSFDIEQFTYDRSAWTVKA